MNIPVHFIDWKMHKLEAFIPKSNLVVILILVNVISLQSAVLHGDLRNAFGSRLYGNVYLEPIISFEEVQQKFEQTHKLIYETLEASTECRVSKLLDAEAKMSVKDSLQTSEDTSIARNAFACGTLEIDAPGDEEQGGASLRLSDVCQLVALVHWECNATVVSPTIHTLQLDSLGERGWSVTSHTWQFADATVSPTLEVWTDATGQQRVHYTPKDFRIASYNVWNSNPPAWLWRRPHDRFRQYSFRMLHLRDMLQALNADVITFQEVRLDTTLGGYDDQSSDDPARKMYQHALTVVKNWYNQTRHIATHVRYHERNKSKWHAIRSSELYAEHCAKHPVEGCLASDASDLAEISNHFTRSFVNNSMDADAFLSVLQQHPHLQIAHIAAALPRYHYVFRPAELYFDTNGWASDRVRDEEGPAIFSRYPIVAHDFLLLSRDRNDDQDTHQRLCLHAVIDVAGEGQPQQLVDVYTAHLSLSAAARERSVQEIKSFVRTHSRGTLQIFTGDLNAEPFETAIKALQDEDDAFVDVWTAIHADVPSGIPDAAVKRYAYTFPSDAPTKRIDYIFARGLKESRCRPTAAYLMGQDPIPGTDIMEHGGGVGMVDQRSPVWASDHRAVIAEVRCDGGTGNSGL